jgi:hypothetical protein
MAFFGPKPKKPTKKEILLQEQAKKCIKIDVFIK